MHAVKRVRRRVSEAAEFCQVSDLMRVTIRNLSTGLRKRVALADALLLRPRVLLLDDFLAGLDRDMRESTGVLLSNVAAFSSVIVTGHELEDFSKWTTRFQFLKDGIVSSTLETAGLSSEELRERLALALRGEG